MTFKELFRRKFGNIVFFADGDGGDGGGGGESWQSQSAYLTANPEAAKAYEKYKTLEDGIKGGHEAMMKTGKPYWLPDDHSKLTDDQKNEIRANVAKMEGVPDTPDGYELKVKEGAKAIIDEQGLADFKVFAKENNIPVGLAEKLLGFQTAFVDRLNGIREDAIKKITSDTFKQFSKDCEGDSNAVLRQTWIKEYLQTFCKDAEGKPDPKMWESVKKRLFFEENGIELVLLRALSDPAQKAKGEGGAPPGGAPQAAAKGSLDYPEMDTK